MLLLVLSILALFIGVGIYPIIKKFPASLSFFDAFVLISLVGLTMLHLIPHSIENAGIPGVLAVALGLGVPSLLHKYQHHHEHDAHHTHDDHQNAKDSHHNTANSGLILLIIIFIGVIIHTLLDGIGLSMSSMDNDMGQMLGLGVLFHRLPIGIFLSIILVPRIGLKKTWAVVIALATSTCLGFVLGHYTLPSAGLTILYLFQGLIAGSLLHVIFHNISIEGHNDSKWPKGLGALAGLGTLAIVEWIAPVHGHEYFSILDIWIDYLFLSAPVWCICAFFIAACYALKHSKSPKLSSMGQTLCNWFDPQPLQSAFGGVLHIFSLSGIALLFSLFNHTTAAIWGISSCLALFCARFCLKSLDCCHSCRPESFCNREKSFPLWTASSWTLIAISTLLASVIPTIASPITEWIETLPTAGSIATAFILFISILLMAIRHRGLTIISVPLMMFAFFSLFQHTHFAWCFGFATGVVLIFLYDYPHHNIESSVEHDHPWKTRYFLAFALSCVLAFTPVLLIPALTNESNHVEITRIEPQVHHHHHEHTHHDEDLHNHDEDLHNHDEDLDHHDEEISGHHGLLTRMKDSPLSFATFILFILTGLFWIMRFGPRHLFETVQGRHHHQHG